MTSYKVLTCLITVLHITGCSESKEQKGKVDMSFSSPQSESWGAEETTYVKSLVQSFANQCKPLARYWSDVESAELSIEPAMPYMERMGWTRSVYVKVKIKDSPEVIPGNFRARGHTCHYNLGSNFHEAGLFASKSPCKMLCETEDYLRLGNAIATPMSQKLAGRETN